MTIFALEPKRASTRKFIPGFLDEMAGAVAEFLVDHGFEIEPIKVWPDDDQDQSGPEWATDSFYAWRGRNYFSIAVMDGLILAGCHKTGGGKPFDLNDPQSLDNLLDYTDSQC